MRVWILMLVLILMGPLMVLSGKPSRASDLYLVVVPPWADRDVVVRLTGGYLVGTSSAPLGILLQSDAPDVASIAHEAGAWWVTGGEVVAAICGVEV